MVFPVPGDQGRTEGPGWVHAGSSVGDLRVTITHEMKIIWHMIVTLYNTLYKAKCRAMFFKSLSIY